MRRQHCSSYFFFFGCRFILRFLALSDTAPPAALWQYPCSPSPPPLLIYRFSHSTYMLISFRTFYIYTLLTTTGNKSANCSEVNCKTAGLHSLVSFEVAFCCCCRCFPAVVIIKTRCIIAKQCHSERERYTEREREETKRKRESDVCPVPCGLLLRPLQSHPLIRLPNKVDRVPYPVLKIVIRVYYLIKGP